MARVLRMSFGFKVFLAGFALFALLGIVVDLLDRPRRVTGQRHREVTGLNEPLGQVWDEYPDLQTGSGTFTDVWLAVRRLHPDYVRTEDGSLATPGDPNPFPGLLKGKCYGRMWTWPGDVPPTEVPFLWHGFGSDEEYYGVRLIGGVFLRTEEELRQMIKKSGGVAYRCTSKGDLTIGPE
jgi:hypothetical protein